MGEARHPARLLVAWLSAWLFAAAVCPAAQWYPGIIHLHTHFSDGTLAPAQFAAAAKAAGAKFIIVTDHYSQIDKEMKAGTPFSISLAGLVSSRGGPWGFDKYYREVTGLTSADFVAIPGAEIDSLWYPEPGNQASSHTLALGVVRQRDDQIGDQYCGKPDHQQDIIDRIRQWGMLPVAAHPSFLRDGRPGDLSRFGRIDYRYDKRPANELPDGQVHHRGLAGVEMWNVDKAGQCQGDTDFYLRLIREGLTPFVTAGSDYHGYRPTELATLGRKTWVYADSLSSEGILTALREGMTYAAQYGASLASVSPLPGEHVTADRATIRTAVAFLRPIGSEKRMVVYRDGAEVQGSRRSMRVGSTTDVYEWTDNRSDGKEHSYVLRVGEVLVTSPTFITASQTPPLRNVYLKPVPCTCKEKGSHGDVHVVLRDGRDVSTGTNGVATTPKLSPDRRTAGWLSGFHASIWGERHFFATKLVICRADKVVRVCETGEERPGMIWDWRFHGDGRVAMAIGAGKRGVQWYELREIATGEVLEHCENPGYFSDAEPRPKWVEGLAEE